MNIIEIADINEMYVHDDLFEHMEFDRSRKILSVCLTDSQTYTKKRLMFIEVSGFCMTSCDYWGSSPHVLGIHYAEADKLYLIPMLLSKKFSEYATLGAEPDLISEKKEVIMEFVSGDKLFVVCSGLKYSGEC